jgi:hypothetical protein
MYSSSRPKWTQETVIKSLYFARKKGRKDMTSKKAKKRTSKKKSTNRRVSKKKAVKKPSGYVAVGEGIIVPEGVAKAVPPSKLLSGFKKAKKEINGMVDEIIDTMTEEYIISEIEFTASFSADGKFMGFGVGGAASIKIKIAPNIHNQK